MKRIIFITGATSGIGKACAERFAANGDKLIINGRRKERLEMLKEELEREYNTEVWCAPFDVQSRQQVFKNINLLAENWKEIDVLVNSAGLALGKDYFDEAEITDWETMVHTNILGVLYVSRAVLPFMIKRKRGHIINIGSVAGNEMYE
ncbi:MAG TPA: SDR family NAD(P)-dependent oxidoreductase, partial [Hanamia sp.]|nr:SDR family NAD(P)-dependent oxidoreductase [Hanamia sp.]